MVSFFVASTGSEANICTVGSAAFCDIYNDYYIPFCIHSKPALNKFYLWIVMSTT